MSRQVGGPELRGRAARLARLLPAGPANAARAPFVLLVVVLLGGGLITLLMLNSALNEGSFTLSELKRETTELTDEQQALQHDVDAHARPDALRRRAEALGMVPGGIPVFVDPDGTVRGVPSPAPTPAVAKPPPPPPRLRPHRPPRHPLTRRGPGPGSGGTPAPAPSPAPRTAPPRLPDPGR
ncbi:septum formation initiator family protein [Streptomyces sp. S399]|uniref:septum formation initiator family protein n=1 Tax=Streptomyces sp. S399 TaxID=3096009 RepID=UPI002A80F881|nr:septum formation initiator family protein [Streptomyces sp. S399]WPR50749.1 septum formation initiator family protein [Streptomyces sp. S399]